jgi:hypothetical protein
MRGLAGYSGGCGMGEQIAEDFDNDQFSQIY